MTMFRIRWCGGAVLFLALLLAGCGMVTGTKKPSTPAAIYATEATEYEATSRSMRVPTTTPGISPQDTEIRRIEPREGAGDPNSIRYKYRASVWVAGAVSDARGYGKSLSITTPRGECAVYTVIPNDIPGAEQYHLSWLCPQNIGEIAITDITVQDVVVTAVDELSHFVTATDELSRTVTVNLATGEWTLAGEPWVTTPTSTPTLHPTQSTATTSPLPPVDPADVAGDIMSAGSSTVFPLAQRIAEGFWDEGYPGQITIDSIGSGAGFERFCVATETDISNASRPIRPKERAMCQQNGRDPLAFRLGTQALAVTVSTDNDFVQDLTLEELAEIFSTAETWQDVRPAWPPEPIQRYVPGTDSGTFDYFVERVFDENIELLLNASNLQLSENNNVLVQGVVASPFSVGVFNYAFADQQRDQLSLLALDGTAPTSQTVEAGSYPLARPLYMYSDVGIMQRKPHVAAFLNYALTNNNTLIGDVGYTQATTATLNEAKQIWLDAMAQDVFNERVYLPLVRWGGGAAMGTEPVTPMPTVAPTPTAMRPTDAFLSDAAFIDEQCGWLIRGVGNDAGKRIVAELRATCDSGQSWTTRYTTTASLGAIDFISRQQGWMIISGTLHTTTDSGHTWQPFVTDVLTHIARVDFVDAQHGWVRSATRYPNHGLLRTTDGGQTWQELDEPCSSFWRPGMSSFVSPTDGWLMCGSTPGAGHQLKTLYRTTDGGQSWQRIPRNADPPDPVAGDLPFGGYLNGFFFLDDEHGWMSSGRFPYGSLWHTTNGGQTWQYVDNDIGSDGTKGRLHFTSPTHGTMLMRVDNDYDAPQGMQMRYVLLRTTDGGQSWEQIYP